MYIAVNEWSDEKAGQYLAVFLKDDVRAFFFHQQSETVKKSFSELSKARKQRYKGGLALLKYKRDFNSRSLKDGEPLHSNEATRVASFPLPNMSETLDRLADAKFFTRIDMVLGYHQIEVAPEDRHMTAFVSPFGLFQYCRLPFGLAGAPGMFQAVIEDMLQVLDAEYVMAYLDDVLCFHSGFE